MKTFREHLSQIAYGQLVDRGHVSPKPNDESEKRERVKRPPQTSPRIVRWPRLAMPH